MNNIPKPGLEHLALSGLGLLVLASCQTKTHPSAGGKGSNPNIVFILADDLGYGDLGCYGQKHIPTPNIDQLAREGMLFTSHYAGSTVCAPSRSSLFTGLHTGHTFIRGNRGVEPEGQYPLKAEILTLAEVLKASGYVTGVFGKWGLGPVGSEGDPNRQGFDTFFGYACQTLAHNYYPGHLWQNQEKIVLDENYPDQKGAYAPIRIHEQALSFIRDHKDTSFFLFYPTTIPHAELIAPDSCMDKFRGMFLPEKSYQGTDSGERFRKGPYASQEECHATFAAMISLLDQQVGEIRAMLKELGLAENTLIVFTSDNGPHREGGADPDYFDSNGPFTGYKRDLYEGGIRVPMIAAWPGTIPAQSTSQHVSAFWDFYPTFCELVGAQAPSDVDGISFLPELIGGKQEQHDFLYWEFHEQGGKQAVRLGKWKGIRRNMDRNPEAPVELYNLEIDPGEEQNCAEVHPEIVAEMVRIMKDEHQTSEVFRFGYEKNEFEKESDRIK
ncbi:MAG TPA: arylsulfatase [Prolixibacteraceae bacterium]|nr:arylsulfatase [Prolixibacteraceae bacterium]